jgi:hypothetical protein
VRYPSRMSSCTASLSCGGSNGSSLRASRTERGRARCVRRRVG